MKHMKRLFAFVAVIAMMTVTTFAQDGMTEDTTGMDSVAAATTPPADVQPADEPADEAANAPTETEYEVDTHQWLKGLFIDGGVGFMAIVVFCLILGLALCIERVIYLNMATTNTKKLLQNIEDALASGGVEAAKEVCRNTRGPVASIFYQGLDRSGEGVDKAEQAVVAYGSVQMGLLEKGLSWIALFIALAPMLGFLGTVLGMIQAFDAIARENNISPQIVAEGIQVALITTVTGLVVAIILQIFYNYIVSKIDGLVNKMEDASISLVDLLIKHDIKNNG